MRLLPDQLPNHFRRQTSWVMVFGLQAGDRNASSLVFCIGGPHGHGAAVRARGDDVISLSTLVLNHQVTHQAFDAAPKSS